MEIEQTKINIVQNLCQMEILIKSIKENVEAASTVQELMQAKSTGMRRILYGLPLDGKCCPYCMDAATLHGADCSNCSYGAEFGVCNNLGSFYTKIMSARKELTDLLLEYKVPFVDME